MEATRNPWEEIDLHDYEAHMALGSVAQLQALNGLMREQFAACPPGSVAVFGVAGGNGLEHVDPQRVGTVYGVDVNAGYLARATELYGGAGSWFVPVRADLTDARACLPQVVSVIANLLVEYVGIDQFVDAVCRTGATFVSCVIQVDCGGGWVSDSPYLSAFDGLDAIHEAVDEARLAGALEAAGYAVCLRSETALPNGKKFVRLDAARPAPAAPCA